MRLFATLLLIIAGSYCAFASATPLTVKEMALMLRSGYSSATVLHELANRGFADQFDAATEKQLLQAGANSALIEALRGGAYQVSSAQIATAKLKPVGSAELNRDTTVPSAGTTTQPLPTRPSPPPDSIYSRLKGDLVYLHEGGIAPFDDEVLENKKFYLLFFSANWSAAGRKFTAQLIDFYNRIAPEHPEFEVIFFSADRSQFGMESYLTQTAMPWPAVAYDKLSGKAGDIQKSLVREIPALVLTDGSGKILAYTHGDGEAVGPAEVLQKTDQILNRGPEASTSQTR
jgi:Thioredoxin-like